jgi:hypothetical protein
VLEPLTLASSPYKRITFDRKGRLIAEKPLLQIVTSWD